VLEAIGRGGFGWVYRARDPALDRDVALKIIEVPSRDPARAADVLREGRLLARIRHPNVVTVHGAQERDGAVGIWMELIRGRSLAQIVRNEGPMGPDEASVVGVSVCRAVAAVHRAGLLHRDIKAQNVMREAGGRIVLMDFGAGWETAAPAQRREVLPMGTPLYMAPELLAGQPASVASDIYSVGVLLFFLVTGAHPVEGRTITDIVLAHGTGRRRLLSDARPDLPEAFVRVVERALSPQPGQRYATPGALMRDLVDAIPRGAASWTDVETEAAGEPAAAGQDDGVLRTPPGRPAGTAAPSGLTLAPASSSMGPAAWLLGTGAGTLLIGALGLLSSLAFDVTLGRLGGFSTDSVFDWWIWGLRSLVSPAVYVAFALSVMWLAGRTWRLFTWLPHGRRAAAWLGEVVSAAAARMGLDNPPAVAHVVVFLQVAALAWVAWRFADLVAAFTSYISTTDLARLAPLAPANERAHDDFRMALPLLMLAMVLSWLHVWRWHRRRGLAVDRTVLAVGVALVLAALFLGQVPYRILRHNEFPRVAFAHERCYVTGERGPELLLYCPDAAVPRNKVVRADDGRLERTTTVESIFSPPDLQRRGR